MSRGARVVLILVALVAVAAVLFWRYGAFPLLPSRGGGQTEFEGPRVADAADVAVPAGYEVEVVAEGLTFPTDVTFDEQGNVYVLEAGYSYGEVFTVPRLLRVSADGGKDVVAEGESGPWNGVAYSDGSFYVAGKDGDFGAILRVTTTGEVTTVLGGLPSLGDHHTNAATMGPDGQIYFGQGTATNAGVVGTDNHAFGWLERHPDFHDVPCDDVTLAGLNYQTENPLTDADDNVTTGAYRPFGTASTSDQVISGAIPCNGAIMRIGPEGGEPELVAWGFRNPYGLAFAPTGELYVVNNSYDERGSRPVYGTGDLLYRVEEGAWYGWPDFHGDLQLDDEDRFGHATAPAPETLLSRHPGSPPAPAAVLTVHSSSNGMSFSTSEAFGHVGAVFIAQLGDMAPQVGKVAMPAGFKVVRVDPDTGVVIDFMVNRDPSGPASYTGTAGLERPISAKFSPDGSELYVVDFGVMTMSEQGPAPREGTGVVWRVVPAGGGAP